MRVCFTFARKLFSFILTLFSSVVFFNGSCVADEPELKPGTIRVIHDEQSPVIELITEYGFTEVSRFKFSAKGIEAMSLRVIAVSKDEVRELGRVATGILNEEDQGSMYLAMTKSITEEAKSKKFASSCSIKSTEVGDGRGAILEGFEVDPAFKFSSSASPTNKTVSAGEELVLWAYCYGAKLDADTLQTVAGLLKQDDSYADLTKEIIIREVQKQGNALVVLAILESVKAHEKQDR